MDTFDDIPDFDDENSLSDIAWRAELAELCQLTEAELAALQVQSA